jgi:6-pyruvoyltetrahydropterin/6-carboxytetrahydropterin synthase
VTIATVTVRHNFETAHRLPNLGGKCFNLHGHSWWADVTVAGLPDDENNIIVEYAALKHQVRRWIDGYLDHGTMLGAGDALVEPLRAEGCKLFVFGGDSHPFTAGLTWPTVENVAELLARVTSGILAEMDGSRWLRVERVRVAETHVNAAQVEQ